MKKVLFATTALVASAGFAAADMSLSGSASFGVVYNDATGSSTVGNEIDFGIAGSGETDGGLSFGASVDLDTMHVDSVDTQNYFGDAEVFISGAGLTLTVGAVDAANDNEGIDDIGYSGLGVDNVVEISGNGSHDVRIDYAFGDIGVAASVDSSNDDWAIGADGSFGQISFAAGFGETGGADELNLYAGYSTGAIQVGAQYSEAGAADAFGLEFVYTQGDLTVTAVYADGATEAYGVGVAYDLGGGASIAAGIADVSGTTMADLGMSFDF